MSTQPDVIAKARVVYTMPGIDAVTVRRDIEYRGVDGDALTMDVYYPANAKSGAPLPAVLFVLGYSDVGGQRIFGRKMKELGSYVSWAQLTAASGVIGITYTTNEPKADTEAALQYVRQNAAPLGIDAKRIGIWSASGNVPNALSLLMQGHEWVECAVLCYGYMLDAPSSSEVADASKRWGFVNPSAGKSMADLPRALPLFIARAGLDDPALNRALDRCLAVAVACNLPVTFVNHAVGPHAFDLFHDSETSREIVRGILAFMRFNLLT